MIQYASRAQLKEKAREQMAGHYGNAILLSICRSLIVFSLTFAVSMTVMKIPSASPTQDSQIPATHILFMRCPLFRVSNAKRMPRAPAGMDSSPVQHNTREQMPQTIEAIDKPLYFGSICGIF